MSYLFELRTQAGSPAYMVANGDNREEALAQVHEQLGLDEGDEVVVLAVHTMH
jgi:hypothetical protein